VCITTVFMCVFNCARVFVLLQLSVEGHKASRYVTLLQHCLFISSNNSNSISSDFFLQECGLFSVLRFSSSLAQG